MSAMSGTSAMKRKSMSRSSSSGHSSLRQQIHRQSNGPDDVQFGKIIEWKQRETIIFTIVGDGDGLFE